MGSLCVPVGIIDAYSRAGNGVVIGLESVGCGDDRQFYRGKFIHFRRLCDFQ